MFCLEVGTAENMWKARTLNGAFSHNFKRCFLYVGSAEEILQTRTLNVLEVGTLEEIKKKHGHIMVHSDAI